MAKEKKKSTFWSDFKAFITKGNVLDMAVGVVVGGAFGKITTSLVNNIIMPPIGVLIGGMNFSELKWVLVEAVAEVPATETTAAIPAVADCNLCYRGDRSRSSRNRNNCCDPRGSRGCNQLRSVHSDYHRFPSHRALRIRSGKMGQSNRKKTREPQKEGRGR